MRRVESIWSKIKETANSSPIRRVLRESIILTLKISSSGGSQTSLLLQTKQNNISKTPKSQLAFRTSWELGVWMRRIACWWVTSQSKIRESKRWKGTKVTDLEPWSKTLNLREARFSLKILNGKWEIKVCTIGTRVLLLSSSLPKQAGFSRWRVNRGIKILNSGKRAP